MRYRWTFIGALALIGAVAVACGGSTPAPSDPRPLPPLVLSGHVSDLNTAAPLAGAVMTILDGPNAGSTRISDAQGNFLFGVLTVGGFTLRARYSGYDSVFQGVNFVEDTTVNFRMRPATQSLSGTWTGLLSFVQGSSGRTEVSIPQLTMAQAGSAISSTFSTAGPYAGTFSGALTDPSSIASTTTVAGTLTVSQFVAGRGPITCTGTSDFTGTVNWTHAALSAPQIALDCGTTISVVAISLDRQQ